MNIRQLIVDRGLEGAVIALAEEVEKLQQTPAPAPEPTPEPVLLPVEGDK